MLAGTLMVLKLKMVCMTSMKTLENTFVNLTDTHDRMGDKIFSIFCVGQNIITFCSDFQFGSPKFYTNFFSLTSVFSSSAVVASITSSTGLSVVSVSAVSTSAASSSCPSSSSSSSSSSGSSPSFEGSFLSKYPQALMLFTASDRALSMKMSQGKTSKIYVIFYM